tara:strand:+ start:60 stop:287 length:228 start_codon:yes stop_codon:yes gene_type:complete
MAPINLQMRAQGNITIISYNKKDNSVAPHACCLWVVLVGGALPVACELCLWAGPTKKNKKQKKNGPLARAIGRLV